MKVFYLGTTKFSEEVLRHLVGNGIEIDTVFTTPQQFSISYNKSGVKNYNYSDMNAVAQELGAKCIVIDTEAGEKLTDYLSYFEAERPDLVLVMGWYFMVPKAIRQSARLGAWGVHASLLPDYAGGAPLVWAIINGESEAGVTLFRLEDGVDDGAVIAQQKIAIEFSDSIKEVYAKATRASQDIVTAALKNIPTVQFVEQDKSKIKVYPQRKPEDGLIDTSKSALELYNFIRAQSSPYPGAYLICGDGKKLIIEKSRLEDL